MVNIQLENAVDKGLAFEAPVFSEESNNVYLAQQIEKSLKEIIEEDMRSSQPLFINVKHDFIRNVFVRIIRNGNCRIFIANKFYCGFNRLKQTVFINACKNETTLVQRFGTLC